MAHIGKDMKVYKYNGWHLQPFCSDGQYKAAMQFAKERKEMAKAAYKRERRLKQAMDALMYPTLPKGYTLRRLIAEGKTASIRRKAKTY